PVAQSSPDYVPVPKHPPSPDYVPGLEHPPSLVQIPYVPEPEYPEYLKPSDDEAPLEDQPLPTDGSPIASSPDDVADSDPEEDPEEDPEDDQADYPTDGGDCNDETSDDDDDDDDTDDEDPEEEPFEDEEARKTVRPEPPKSASMEACIARHDMLAVEIRMRALLLSTFCMTNTPEANVPPRKRVCLTTPSLRFKVEESSAAGAARQPGPTESDLRIDSVKQAGYGITDTWDEIVDTFMEINPTTLEGVDQRVTKLDTTVRQRTDEFEIRFKEAQDDRALLRARVNTLFRDRPDHHRTTMLMDRERCMPVRHGHTLRTGTQLTTTLERIEILEARDPEPQEGPAEAVSSC
nr:hypothetical protein [Tanacetum cinerariifolium]